MSGLMPSTATLFSKKKLNYAETCCVQLNHDNRLPERLHVLVLVAGDRPEELAARGAAVGLEEAVHVRLELEQRSRIPALFNNSHVLNSGNSLQSESKTLYLALLCLLLHGLLLLDGRVAHASPSRARAVQRRRLRSPFDVKFNSKHFFS